MKDFNDTGLCIPEKHYMVNTTPKLHKVMKLIEKGKYFTFNRPRQFGKTTSISLLFKKLQQDDTYLPLRMSFEGIGDDVFKNQDTLCQGFMRWMAKAFKTLKLTQIADSILEKEKSIVTLELLSQFITRLCESIPQKLVLMIDEVDKSSNNELFLSFVGMLRDKYLLREEGEATFHSVILIGMHDVKNLKQKLRPEAQSTLNSPWNIAVDFKIDMTFHPQEIETMLVDYVQETGIQMDIPVIAERIYYYTSGYPFLVSKLCKFIEEEVLEETGAKEWTLDTVEAGFRKITYSGYTTTLFDSLFKYMEGNEDLYELGFQLVMNGKIYDFTMNDPVIDLAVTYGMIRDNEGHCQIHNRIFEQRMYAYYLSRNNTKKGGYVPLIAAEKSAFIEGNQLQIPVILQRFQAFMQENYTTKDIPFLEREGRLLFLSFLKPILNGKGFDFKEPVVGEERRMDVVLTYQNQRYVVELKRWEGKKYHEEGLQQLSDYLDLYGLNKGYLLIFDFRKNKEYKEELIQFGDKEIFAVWV
jgi:hypothetical protein